jgi:hypothetical protein
MAEGARRDPGSAKVLSKLLRRALFWGLVRTYPFPPALRALSPRNRRIVRDMWSIRRSGLFDSEWYLSRYPAYYVAWQMRPEAGATAVRGSRPKGGGSIQGFAHRIAAVKRGHQALDSIH